MRSNDTDGCHAILGRHRRELGYISLPTLRRAAERGELYATDAAAAYVWRRRDGQTTLHAIASDARGHGSRLLRVIIADSKDAGQQALLARCPANLNANGWYIAQGFNLARIEPGKHIALNVWTLDLR